MVKGLEVFYHHFRNYANRYMLIGGAACDLLMENAGLEFRATKDLDIVLCIETLDVEFTRAFWDFIRAGGYRITSSTGERRFYRFDSPQNGDFPFMLEIFSRKPDILTVPDGCHLIPIPIDGDVSSLSAILLNDDYYSFIHSGKKLIRDVIIVDAEHLIPLKALAWLNLSRLRTVGEIVERNKINKHKNDVLRLYQVIDPAFKADIPISIQKDMGDFLDAMESESVDLVNLGIKSKDKNAILIELRRIYIQD
jgi:hypothetical protein